MQFAVQARRRAVSGFTLVELMVTVAVLAIVSAVAAPAMQGLIRANRLNTAASEMTAALQLARSEAIRRNSRVSVCASADSLTCTASADWSSWIVRGAANVADGAEVIRVQAAPDDVELSGPVGGIVFAPSGQVQAQQVVAACIPTDNPDENVRQLTVLVSGSVLSANADGGGVCP